MKKILIIFLIAVNVFAQSLTGVAPSASYKDLLHLNHLNTGVDGTLRAIYDGAGNASALQISTTGISGGVMTGTSLALTGTTQTTTTISANVTSQDAYLEVRGSNTLGNIHLGRYSGISNTTGQYNTALGIFALQRNATGNNNTALGKNTLLWLTAGNDNTAIGQGALENTTGTSNTAVGSQTARAITSAIGNVALGVHALLSNQTGNYNVSIGAGSLQNTTGAHNAVVGSHAMYTTLGDSNTVIGDYAGELNTGSRNVFIGNKVAQLQVAGDDLLWIDNSNTSMPLIQGNFATNSLIINGTLTATGNFASNGQISGTNEIVNLAVAGVGAWFRMGGNSNANQRWLFGKDASAESGGNAGSNFKIYSYSDTGTNIGNPLTIERATGNITFSNAVTAIGLLTGAGLTLSSGDFTGNAVTRGTDSFTTTATADTAAITGASVNDIYMVNYITAVTAAEAPLSVVSTATGFIVTRPAGTTSGASYAWMRQK